MNEKDFGRNWEMSARTKYKAYYDADKGIISCGIHAVAHNWYAETGDNQDEANAKTWCIAHNAANAIDAMGLDGDKAIKTLPALLSDYGDGDNSNEEIANLLHSFVRAIIKDKPDGE